MKEEVYSIRMRAAEGGPHEQGGLHISGGETLVAKQSLEATAALLLKKALSHSRGEADFIQLVVEKVAAEKIVRFPPLTVTTDSVESVEQGRHRAAEYLRSFGISETAAARGIELLQHSTNLRGAAILSASTGNRMDKCKLRGIRATRMGWDQEGYASWSSLHRSLESPRVAEAIALATKVAHAPFVVAELCWSDDPEYVTGYVANREKGYVRITHLKEKGSLSGGRVFFVSDFMEMDCLQAYLEETPVWIG